MQSNETLTQNQTLASEQGAEKLKQIINGCEFTILSKSHADYHFKSIVHPEMGTYIERHMGPLPIRNEGFVSEPDSNISVLVVTTSLMHTTAQVSVPMCNINILTK